LDASEMRRAPRDEQLGHHLAGHTDQNEAPYILAP
jgi:hypothetical protein